MSTDSCDITRDMLKSIDECGIYRQIRMLETGVPITDCLIRRVTKYSGFQDACLKFSFLDLHFRQKWHNSNMIKLGILQFCCWLQRNIGQSDDNVFILNVHDG